MSRIESIKQELLDFGFINDGNFFIHEKEINHTIVINGVPHNQTQRQIFKMEYIGDGCELDSESNEIEGTEFSGFDIKDENDDSVTTIYIKNLEELRYYVAL